MAKGTAELNKVYNRKGFAGVWQRTKHHGIKAWVRARHWAQVRIGKASKKNRHKFKDAREVYAKKVKWLKEHKDKPPPPVTANLVTFDGRTVPGWIANILTQARSSGRWHGTVISGYRSPAYSESLCEAMCGAPACPGRCAGRASRHACPPTGTGVPHEGAVDVSDPYSLEAYCRSVGAPLYGGSYALPADPNHFSIDGR